MKDLPRHLVGAVVMILAAMVLGAIFFFEIPEGNREVALLAIGIVFGWSGAVVTFHFGSSQGSKDKTDHLAGMGD